ncbi:MAG: enoyl-CoA hydratase/isomerase family protein [Pseudomonadales bacterium]|nr:enoyl-CoA hydratase/isomerase family protein [Pseudomonadales bacterium]
MKNESVAIEFDGPLAILTLQHGPHNLLSPPLMDGVLEGLDTAMNSGSRAVLIMSGLRHFSAGADVSLFEAAMGDGDGLETSPLAFLNAIEACPLPIVAAVHGVCVGGGLELALACDIIIAARSSKIGSVEATIGLNPLMGGIQRQVQRAGALRAKEMSLLGRRYDAETMERWNLVNTVVNDEKLASASHALAMELANGPTVAHRITKELVKIAVDQGVGAADAVMEEKQLALWSSEDLKTGLESLMKNGPGLAEFKGE